jgi:D-aspartate ligase
MRMSTEIPALVVGGGITPLGVVRILGRAGIPVLVWCPRGDIVARSRWFGVLPGNQAWRNGGQRSASLPDLEALPLERAVLLPCSDEAVSAVAGLPPTIRSRFPASVPSPETLGKLVNKARFAELLAREKIPHPRTVPLPHAGDPGGLDLGQLAGGFLKPVDSQPFFRRFGRKAFQLRDRETALARVREAQDAGLDVVLQEYIPGPPTAHYFIDGFRDRCGSVRAWFARRRLRMFPPDFGNSTCMVSVPLAEVGEAVASLARLFAAIAYRGVFSAEFKWDERDGHFKLLEVNARPWWYVEYAAWCGVDVVGLAYLDALERPVPDISRYQVGRRCVYPSYDLEAYRAMARSERPSLPALVRSWIGARQPVFQLDDPVPGLVETLARFRGALRRRLGT